MVVENLAGRLPYVIGRITTLYGPGQDLQKNQGLVSKLCLQAVKQQPISVFAPLDTIRDYLFASDAASQAISFMDAAAASGETVARVRNLVNGSTLSIGALSSLVRHVSHRRAGELHVVPAHTGAHVHDLRVRSQYGHEIAGLDRMPIAAGVRRVYEDVLFRYVQGRQGLGQ